MNPATTSTRRRGQWGPWTLGHVIGVEIALAVVVAVPELPWQWRAGAAAAGVLLGFGFTRGRSWWGWLGNWIRWRARRRVDRRGTAEGGPRLRTATIGERGVNLGIGFDGTGWFAAVRLEGDQAPQAAFTALTGVLHGPGLPVSSVQLVTQTVPGAGSGWFANRDSWFVVRRDVAGSHQVAADRGGGEVGVHRALSGVVSRLMKSRPVHGVAMRPMESDQLTEALSYSVDGGVPADADTVEHWRSWRHGELGQAGFELTGRLPDDDTAKLLWTEISGLATRFSCVSLALRPASRRPADGRLMLRGIVRLAAEPEELAGLGRKLTELASRHHVRLRRMDGAHGPAGYASAVTGGVW